MWSIFKKNNSSGVFVKTEDGFIRLEDKIAKLSINNISIFLGYDSYHIHTYHGNFNKKNNIDIVVFEVFSDNIIFVLVKNKNKKPTEKALNQFLKNFNYSEEYDSIFIRDYLLKGIDNKSLSLEFLSKVLDINVNKPNQEVLVEKLNIKLFFVNGYLASFKLTNDLKEWARQLKNINKDIIANYAKLSKKYWIDNYERIFDEVNIQSESFANTPYGYKNEFINLHRSEFDTINFLMLLVCHYNKRITENQFKNYNYGRYVKLDNFAPERNVYELGKFNYFFEQNGDLLNVEQKK